MFRQLVNGPKTTSEVFDEEHYIRGLVPSEVADTIPSVFDYVEYEFSAESVWELFLLHISWRYMPLVWHSRYAEAEYIFTRSDLKKLLKRWPLARGGEISKDGTIKRCFKIDLTTVGKKVAAYLDDESILPRVTLLSDCEAVVDICYWSNWRGFARNRVLVRRENNTTKFYTESELYDADEYDEVYERNTLVPYKNPIRL